jgi:hypothetical protein
MMIADCSVDSKEKGLEEWLYAQDPLLSEKKKAKGQRSLVNNW